MKRFNMKAVLLTFVMAATLSVAIPAAVHAEDKVTTMAATSDVYIRSGAGTNYSIVGAIPAGGVCQVFDMTSDGWYKVTYKGVSGYSYYKYINWEGSDDNDVKDGNSTVMYAVCDLKIRENPTTDSRQVGSIPSGAGVKVTNKNSGWFKVDYNGVKGWSYGEYLAFGQGSSSSSKSGGSSTPSGSSSTKYPVCGLNLRASADSNSAVLTVIPAGAELKVTPAGNGWYSTTYGGKSGYCYGDYLSGTRPSGTSTVDRPVSNDVTGNTTYLYTVSDVNMRSGPSKDYSVITAIPGGTQVVCTVSQDGWYKVSYNGYTGWTSGSYLSNTKGGSQVVNNSSYSGTMKTTGDVYMRAGADKSYEALAVVPCGTSCKITASKNGWYQTTYNGKTGWISGRFLTL